MLLGALTSTWRRQNSSSFSLRYGTLGQMICSHHAACQQPVDGRNQLLHPDSINNHDGVHTGSHSTECTVERVCRTSNEGGAMEYLCAVPCVAHLLRKLAAHHRLQRGAASDCLKMGVHHILPARRSPESLPAYNLDASHRLRAISGQNLMTAVIIPSHQHHHV